jgi:hypothetical protein
MKYTNTSFFKIERHFGKPFFKVLGDIDNLTLEGICYLIYVGSETDETFEEFSNKLDLSTIQDLMPKVLEAINEAFNTGKKKMIKKV